MSQQDITITITDREGIAHEVQAPTDMNMNIIIAGFLNKQYTVWGQVIEGMDAIDQIKRGEPVQDPDSITTMRVAADV